MCVSVCVHGCGWVCVFRCYGGGVGKAFICLYVPSLKQSRVIKVAKEKKCIKYSQEI